MPSLEQVDSFMHTALLRLEETEDANARLALNALRFGLIELRDYVVAELGV